MKKFKNWLRTDVGIRFIKLFIIVTSAIFIPYLFGLMFGFGDGPVIGSWFMGFLILIIALLLVFLGGLLVLGCITYVQYGEFEPGELFDDIGIWIEDKYDGLINTIKNDN